MAQKNNGRQGDKPLTKAERREAARTEAKRQREEAAKRKKRNRIVAVAVTVVAVAALAIGVTVIIATSNSEKSNTAVPAGGYLYSPSGSTTGNQVVVSIYSDYICPICGDFENAASEVLEEKLENDSIIVDYHPIAILDRFSQDTKYSTRSATAAAAVADLELDKLSAFNKELFENQPEENSAGLTDDEIADLARNVGVSESTIAKFTSDEYLDKATKSTDQALADGITGTPTVKIDGVDYSVTNNDITSGAADFRAAVEKAIADKK